MIQRSHRVLSYLLSFSIFLTALTGFSVQTVQASPQPASAQSAPPSQEELGLTEDPIDESSLLEITSLRTAATDLSDNTSEYGYNANDDLISMTDPLDNTTSASYDEDHNVEGVTTPEGDTAGFTYDSFGNVTKTKTGTTPFIESHAGYSSDGNFIQTMTDPLGKVITYNYNTANGLLQSLTDAMGKTTSYTYDAVTDQLKGVSKQVDGQTVAVGYTYTGDDLSGISHNGFAYVSPKTCSAGLRGLKSAVRAWSAIIMIRGVT